MVINRWLQQSLGAHSNSNCRRNFTDRPFLPALELHWKVKADSQVITISTPLKNAFSNLWNYSCKCIWPRARNAVLNVVSKVHYVQMRSISLMKSHLWLFVMCLRPQIVGKTGFQFWGTEGNPFCCTLLKAQGLIKTLKDMFIVRLIAIWSCKPFSIRGNSRPAGIHLSYTCWNLIKTCFCQP